jgi:hypothetical protein
MDLFKDVTLNAVQIIQLMVAPVVMISACGLLLLSINNRYSAVVNRIRGLNEEKRRLMIKVGERPLSTDDNVRLESIAHQINLLVERGRLVKNSVLYYSGAIALFTLTSLVLGFSSFLAIGKLNYIILVTFLLGMIALLGGVLYALLEAHKGYEIILYEVKSHE